MYCSREHGRKFDADARDENAGAVIRRKDNWHDRTIIAMDVAFRCALEMPTDPKAAPSYSQTRVLNPSGSSHGVSFVGRVLEPTATRHLEAKQYVRKRTPEKALENKICTQLRLKNSRTDIKFIHVARGGDDCIIPPISLRHPCIRFGLRRPTLRHIAG
jgi:hypothetical protein